MRADTVAKGKDVIVGNAIVYKGPLFPFLYQIRLRQNGEVAGDVGLGPGEHADELLDGLVAFSKFA